MPLIRPLAHRNLLIPFVRAYATVDAATIVARPPRPPVPIPLSTQDPDPRSTIDGHVLAALAQPGTSSRSQASLPELITQYVDRSGHVLNFSLPYEPSPAANRRTDFDARPEDSAVSMVAHCVSDGDLHKITLCSGFALEGPGQREGESLTITCAHTFEEIRRSPLLHQTLEYPSSEMSNTTQTSGTFIITGGSVPGLNSMHLNQVSSVMSSLRRSDLLLLSKAGPSSTTLPVSPYPAPQHTRIRAHFVVDQKPDDIGWRPWVGGMWSKWVKGSVLGYRDFSGREAQPGTYDALSHLIFEPLPTAGSSGGPIVDEETGAVVGIMLGTRMDNRIEGVRGWGAPSETIFEMFNLPGLKGKR